MPEPVLYTPANRPEVEVLVDGTWRPGELRAWFARDDGWWGNVAYRTGPGEQRLATLPQEQIRPAVG